MAAKQLSSYQVNVTYSINHIHFSFYLISFEAVFKAEKCFKEHWEIHTLSTVEVAKLFCLKSNKNDIKKYLANKKMCLLFTQV